MTKPASADDNDGSAVVVDQDGHVLDATSRLASPAASRSEAQGFADMGLAIGDALQVSSLDVQDHASRVLRLIGWRAPLTLLLEDNDETSDCSAYKVQEHLQLRFYSRQHAFQFDAQVLRVCRTPYPYLHVSYPTQVVRTAKRTSPRVATELIVSISRLESKRRYLAGGQATSMAGLLLDLSPDGALVQAKEPLGGHGARLRVHLRIKRSALDAMLTLTGRIRSLRRADSGKGRDVTLHGIQFEAMELRDRLILQSMMYEELLLAQTTRVPPLAAPGTR